MQLELRLFVPSLFDCDDQPDNPLCQAVESGVMAAEQARGYPQVPSTFDRFVVVEFLANGQEEQELNVATTPTLVFLSDGVALTKMDRPITAGRVKEMYLYLAGLEPLDGSGGYVTADGTVVGRDELFNLSGAGGLQMGLPFGSLGDLLGGCPRWMPRAICALPNLILVLFVLVAILYVTKIFR